MPLLTKNEKEKNQLKIKCTFAEGTRWDRVEMNNKIIGLSYFRHMDQYSSWKSLVIISSFCYYIQYIQYVLWESNICTHTLPVYIIKQYNINHIIFISNKYSNLDFRVTMSAGPTAVCDKVKCTALNPLCFWFVPHRVHSQSDLFHLISY